MQWASRSISIPSNRIESSAILVPRYSMIATIFLLGIIWCPQSGDVRRTAYDPPSSSASPGDVAFRAPLLAPRPPDLRLERNPLDRQSSKKCICLVILCTTCTCSQANLCVHDRPEQQSGSTAPRAGQKRTSSIHAPISRDTCPPMWHFGRDGSLAMLRLPPGRKRAPVLRASCEHRVRGSRDERWQFSQARGAIRSCEGSSSSAGSCCSPVRHESLSRPQLRSPPAPLPPRCIRSSG
jgi:hypothetical protein